MGYKTIMDTTINRSVYNKSRKIYLDNTGKIKCTICPYHKCENGNYKFYGSQADWYWNSPKIGDCLKIARVRYPNWKLVSRNRKQWMKKPLKVKRKNYKYFEDYFELFF
jgi:hypothetical protein